MVRLKGGDASEDKTPKREFQFQNGTIKRIISILSSFDLHVFQFQNGTIKRMMCLIQKDMIASVSIPKWYD